MHARSPGIGPCGNQPVCRSLGTAALVLARTRTRPPSHPTRPYPERFRIDGRLKFYFPTGAGRLRRRRQGTRRRGGVAGRRHGRRPVALDRGQRGAEVFRPGRGREDGRPDRGHGARGGVGLGRQPRKGLILSLSCRSFVLRFDSTERASPGFLRPDACSGRGSGTFGGARAVFRSLPLRCARRLPPRFLYCLCGA